MNAAATGFITIALAFPIYLLWKGELPAYLALMTGGALTTSATGASTTQQSYGGTVTAPATPTPANPFGMGGGTLNPFLAPETIPATP
jgi:hypothetical protein